MASNRTQTLRRLMALQGTVQSLRAARVASAQALTPPRSANPLAVDVARLKAQLDSLSQQILKTQNPPTLKTVYRDGEGLIVYVVERPITEDELSKLDLKETESEEPE